MDELSLLIDAWPVTDPGQVKTENEDFVAVYEPDDPQLRNYSGNLYVVADGTGEATSGTIASHFTALKIISTYYQRTELDLGVRLRQAIQDVNGELYRYVERNPELKKISTTVTAVAVRGELYHIASVGNSRVYLVRRGQPTQLTRDHTLVAGLIAQKTITPEEAREHPQRDVLLRNLGSQPTIEVDLFDGRLAPDDRLVLCTDGLTRYLDDQELATVATESQPTAAAERMIALANERGGHDNITAIVLGARMGIPTPRTPLPYSWDKRDPVLGAPAPLEPAPAQPPPVAPPTVTPIEHPTQPPPPPIQPPPPVESTPLPPTQPPPPVESVPPLPTPTPPPQAAPPVPSAAATTPIPQPTPQVQPTPYGVEPIPQAGQPKTYRPPDAGRGPAGGGRRNILIGVLAVVVLTAAGIVAAITLLPALSGGQEQAEQPEDTGLPVVAFTASPDPNVTLPPPTLAPDDGAAAEVLPTQQLTPPGMVLIEAGEFLRGVDDDEITLAVRNCINEGGGDCQIEFFDDATPQQNVSLAAFYIDRTEVTNAQYALCVAAAGCDPPLDTVRYDDPAYTNHPVTNVTWAQSASYCAWAGKRLPTEAEWEKAARGVEGRVWPWGDAWEPGKANTLAAQLGGPSTVESFAGDVSPYGVIGMSGNVSEWVQDWYQGSYENLALVDPQGPLAQPGDEPFKVARGGAYRSLSSFARGAHRLEVNSGSGADWLGIRCAASLGGAPIGQPAAAPTEAPAAETTPETTPVPSPTPSEDAEVEPPA